MVQLLIFKSKIVVNLSTRFLPWPTVFYIFINYDLEGFRIISGFVCSLTHSVGAMAAQQGLESTPKSIHCVSYLDTVWNAEMWRRNFIIKINN